MSFVAMVRFSHGGQIHFAAIGLFTFSIGLPYLRHSEDQGGFHAGQGVVVEREDVSVQQLSGRQGHYLRLTVPAPGSARSLQLIQRSDDVGTIIATDQDRSAGERVLLHAAGARSQE